MEDVGASPHQDLHLARLLDAGLWIASPDVVSPRLIGASYVTRCSRTYIIFSLAARSLARYGMTCFPGAAPRLRPRPDVEPFGMVGLFLQPCTHGSQTWPLIPHHADSLVHLVPPECMHFRWATASVARVIQDIKYQSQLWVKAGANGLAIIIPET